MTDDPRVEAAAAVISGNWRNQGEQTRNHFRAIARATIAAADAVDSLRQAIINPPAGPAINAVTPRAQSYLDAIGWGAKFVNGYADVRINAPFEMRDPQWPNDFGDL